MTIDHHQRVTGVLEPELRRFQARPHDPVTRFTNRQTEAIVITRDAAIYRLFDAWVEQPFDRSARHG